MSINEIIDSELKKVKAYYSEYETERRFYGKNYVNDNMDKFDCIAQLEYHFKILILLIELRERRKNDNEK